MIKSELILKYFPELTEYQLNQLDQLDRLYRDWNAKINVISRKDIENLYERHILHSLAIAKIVRFKSSTTVLDAGTGGGFPGIPLAIFFPDVHFHLIDSTSKKLLVVNNIANETGLKNISSGHCRFEDHKVKYDFIVSRAVSTLHDIESNLFKNISPKSFNEIPNGILYLKGGDIENEVRFLKNRYKIHDLSMYFQEDFFSTKKLVHIYFK